MTNFEDWMDKVFGETELENGTFLGWGAWDYTPDHMRMAFEAGKQSVALDELARKGQILDEIMAHYEVDNDE